MCTHTHLHVFIYVYIYLTYTTILQCTGGILENRKQLESQEFEKNSKATCISNDIMVILVNSK